MVSLSYAYNRMAKVKHLLDNVKVTIWTTGTVKDGPFTKPGKPVAIVTDYSARVIKGTLNTQQQREFLPDTYDAILIIDTGIDIPAGCTIDATDLAGQVTHYTRATRGYAGYHSHQEVAMVLDAKAGDQHAKMGNG
ncbi:hypothetical protein [Lacticaseibacillus sp. N501-2]|uniref:hypothetical protein n=1 Tax=Lacticaseibacillus salsurae TaxID=3367729 RepID=UPI0038B3DFB5